MRYWVKNAAGKTHFAREGTVGTDAFNKKGTSENERDHVLEVGSGSL